MIVFINPNSTQTFTDRMLAVARATHPTQTFEGWTNSGAPAAIQGREDGDAAVPLLLNLVEKADAAGAEAIVIGCFDDTGLNEANRRARCPVIGIGQAAYHLAALCGGIFSVVTTLSVSCPILEENIKSYGLASRLGRVRASEVPVLELESDTAAASGRVLAEAESAITEEHASCIVLGCAGMSALTKVMRQHLSVPVIDGVEAAAQLATALAQQRSRI